MGNGVSLINEGDGRVAIDSTTVKAKGVGRLRWIQHRKE